MADTQHEPSSPSDSELIAGPEKAERPEKRTAGSWFQPAEGVSMAEKIKMIEVSAENIEVELGQLKFHESKAQRQQRWGALLVGIGVVGVALSPWLPFVGIDPESRSFIIAVGLIAVSGMALWMPTIDDLSILRERIVTLVARQKTGSAGHAGSDYFERLVNMNIENLERYYALIKTQAANSFAASVIMGVLGFFLLGGGLTFGFRSEGDTEQTVAYLTAGAGLVTEFMAAVFFYLYNRTIFQMRMYHGSLISVQNILLSFKMVNDVSDSAAKNRMIENIMAYVLGGRGTVSSNANGDVLPPVVAPRS